MSVLLLGFAVSVIPAGIWLYTGSHSVAPGDARSRSPDSVELNRGTKSPGESQPEATGIRTFIQKRGKGQGGWRHYSRESLLASSGRTSLLESRFEGREVVQQAMLGSPANGSLRRISVLKSAFKVSFIRVVDRYAIEPKTGREVLLHSVAMAADRLIILRHSGTLEDELRQFLEKLGLVLNRKLRTPLGYVAELPSYDIDAFDEIIDELNSRAGPVELAEPDYFVFPSLSSNDPRFQDGTLWALHNIGQNGGAVDADIDAPEAWDVRTDASSAIVAVIDTGVRYSHQDLTANMWINVAETAGDGIDNDANGVVDDIHGFDAFDQYGDPMDNDGHGTHVAGTIGARGNNGLGVVGVAWEVQLMALRFLGDDGGLTSDAIDCIDYAREHGAEVMSNSWGGGGFSLALRQSIERARDDDIVFVAAAGNDAVNTDTDAHYPSAYTLDNIVAVAATTRSDSLSSFSNFGVGTVDLAAPGSSIFSTFANHDSSYTQLNGTSMATPHVSGVLALLRAQFTGDSYLALINRLLSGVDAVDALRGKCRSGGRLNLSNSLASTSSSPPGDDFSGALELSGISFSVSANSLGASAEIGEPDHAGAAASASLWWKWFPPLQGEVVVSTRGSAIDTRLAVYQGSTLDDLQLVAGNDDDPDGGNTSLIRFQADAETTFFIAVDGVGGDSGAIVLNGNGSFEIVNDAFAFRTPIESTAVPTTGTNIGATKEAGEPDHGGNAGGKSVWWVWTAPVSSQVTITTAGSNYDTLLGVYTGDSLPSLTLVAGNDDVDLGVIRTSIVTFAATVGVEYQIAVDGWRDFEGFASEGLISLVVVAPSFNDDFADAILLGLGDFDLSAQNVGANLELGEPQHAINKGGASVWWSWSPAESGSVAVTTRGSSFDTLLAVYTGSSLNGLTVVAQNDDEGELARTSRVTFEAQLGTQYHIAVDGQNGRVGLIRLSTEQPAPANDRFADRSVLFSDFASVIGSNEGAEKEAGEPDHGGNSGGASIWYSWEPDVDGSVVITTDGSTFDTLLAVYTGSELSNLALVDENSEDNDNGFGTTSLVVFDAFAGATYFIAVDGFNASTGQIQLNRVSTEPPHNDDLADRIVLQPGTVFGSNANATLEPGEPFHFFVTGGKSVWWSFTPNITDDLTLSTSGSTFDTILAVYTGNSIETLALVDNDDDSGSGLTSRLTFSATSATEYLIAVDGFGGDSGTISLSLSLESGVIHFDTAQYTGDESSGNLAITLVRTGGDSGLVSVDLKTGDGTARVTDGDYIAIDAQTVEFADGVASRTITLQLLDDTEFELEETLTLALSNPSGGAQLGSPSIVNVKITSDDVGLAAWQEHFFDDSERLLSEVSGELADPDLDGLVNLMEFALNSDPRVGSLSDLPVVTLVDIAGVFFPAIVYRKSLAAGDLVFVVEVTSVVSVK